MIFKMVMLKIRPLRRDAQNISGKTLPAITERKEPPRVVFKSWKDSMGVLARPHPDLNPCWFLHSSPEEGRPEKNISMSPSPMTIFSTRLSAILRLVSKGIFGHLSYSELASWRMSSAESLLTRKK